MGIAENEKVWVALSEDGAYGPLNAVEIKQALLDGNLKDDSSIWKKGWSAWKQLKSIPLFAFECRKSAGTDRPLTDAPVPSAEGFESIISPKVSVTELGDGTWSSRRITIVAGSTLLGGAIGAILATGLTARNEKEEQEACERNMRHIATKNT